MYNQIPPEGSQRPCLVLSICWDCMLIKSSLYLDCTLGKKFPDKLDGQIVTINLVFCILNGIYFLVYDQRTIMAKDHYISSDTVADNK